MFGFILFSKIQSVFKMYHLLNLGSSPCDNGNHYFLRKGGWRGTKCSSTATESMCDRYILRNTWYKVIGHDDVEPRKMAVGPVDMFMCGTDYPLYLVNGNSPINVCQFSIAFLISSFYLFLLFPDVKLFHKLKWFLLSDTHPVVDGTVTTTKVCMRDRTNPCVKQYEVQILKCESFYLYNLSRPDTCDIAYCFGKIFSCSL